MSKQNQTDASKQPMPTQKADTSQAESALGKASPVWPHYNQQFPDGLLPYA